MTIPSKTLSVDKSDGWLGTTVGQPHSDESFGIMVGLRWYLSLSEFMFANGLMVQEPKALRKQKQIG